MKKIFCFLFGHKWVLGESGNIASSWTCRRCGDYKPPIVWPGPTKAKELLRNNNMLISLDKDERELIWFSLSIRKNLIETGDPVMSAYDAQRAGREKQIRVLNDSQRDFVKQIEGLMNRMLGHE